MKRFLFNLILPVVAFFAITQNISAQWTPNIPLPTLISNLNPTVSRVGIGITNPKQKLQIAGGNLLLDYTNGSATTGNLFFGLPTYNPTSFPSGNATIDPTTNNGMRMSYNNGTNKNGFIDVRTNSALTDGLVFRVDQNNGGSERMRICANGNVGIGTATITGATNGPALPSQKLHVHNGAIMVSGSNSAGGAMVLFGDNNLAAHPYGRWGIEYVPTRGLNFWKAFTVGNNGANYHLFLQDDGKVSMGIDPADICPNGPLPGTHRLYVKGSILTERIKIANYCTANWADYVFAPDYQLKPLAEVEAFVKTNKHLPNVPSAQDIEKDGLDVADMLSKQMEKIEELMLHTIALNKRVEKLEAENAALKQQPATTVSHR